MEGKLHVLPDKSSGIFAGATGEMEILAPEYKMAGFLVIETANGDLRMDFLEAGTRETLNADLWVNGEESSGILEERGGRPEVRSGGDASVLRPGPILPGPSASRRNRPQAE